MKYTQEPYNDPRQGYHFFRLGVRRRFPKGLKWIIIINVAIFFIEALVFGSIQQQTGSLREAIRVFMNQSIFAHLALSPVDVFGRGHIWQLLTYGFLHDPNGLLHIFFNMFFLYMFGREVEQALGTRRFVAFYLTAVVFSGLAFCVFHIFLRDTLPCVGASGAVMAVLMVYALTWPNRIILFMFIIPMRIRTFVIFVIIFETLSLLRMDNGVANMAHLGGLLYGYLVVRHGPRVARYFAGYIRNKADNIDQGDQRRLDEILDKVSRQGMNSLSWSERRFLQKMSKGR